ncbi:twin-arginine translocation signal domain-containing protein [Bradyrhizobium sp. SSUT18]|uniref:twin-arginine translocation signal domain-containing protein n=1 Tax=Bradyrhizobium sp. SSUT18 TaxID=3040602 RepID=UPI002448DF3D|nr:twin-arginine translocation signal domain-containing protein [Bradyrhizobium sp. SSUT18]MDH2406773.1 twin-arginine translocation signal domain-containing protein [Bradyrhizobium sp. SSUT18]
MTSTINPDDDPAATTRRRFLKGGTAALGGAALGAGAILPLRRRTTFRPTFPMDEGTGRADGKPALWSALAVRKGDSQEHLEDPEAVGIAQ